MNADGSQPRQLVNMPGLDDKPQWSPDGTRIGFATTRTGTPQLLAVDPETGKLTLTGTFEVPTPVCLCFEP